MRHVARLTSAAVLAAVAVGAGGTAQAAPKDAGHSADRTTIKIDRTTIKIDRTTIKIDATTIKIDGTTIKIDSAPSTDATTIKID